MVDLKASKAQMAVLDRVVHTVAGEMVIHLEWSEETDS